MPQGFRFEPFRDRWLHLCVDMQRMFAEDTEWHTPWLSRVLPNVVSIAEVEPYRTIFTRFIPPQSPENAVGAWRRYYQRWGKMTRDRIDPCLLDLVPELQSFVPPARIEDKGVMSVWQGGMHAQLQAAAIDTLIVTGAETEVCILASVMGAIDRGYRVVLVEDAVCSGADETHDAMLGIYRSRFGMQVEVVTTAEIIAARRDGYC